MTLPHLEILVEEPSMEAFLRAALPKMLAERATFAIHSHQGKHDLFRKLEKRLRGYSRWLPASMRFMVLVDRDDDDCHQLKQTMEKAAAQAALRTRTTAGGQAWQVVTRIAIEELEAWFFGEWTSVRTAYPRVSGKVPSIASYRDPDAIKGGTWEALDRVLQAAGYFSLGIRKVEVAAALGRHMNPDINTSRSFSVFRTALLDVVTA